MKKIIPALIVLSSVLTGCNNIEEPSVELDQITNEQINALIGTTNLIEEMKGTTVLSNDLGDRTVTFKVTEEPGELINFSTILHDDNSGEDLKENNLAYLGPEEIFFTLTQKFESLDLGFGVAAQPLIVNNCGAELNSRALAANHADSDFEGDYTVQLESKVMSNNVCHIERIETFNDKGFIVKNDEQYFVSPAEGILKYIHNGNVYLKLDS